MPARPTARSRSSSRRGAPTAAVAVLLRADVSFELHEFHHDPDGGPYGAQAAAALGVDRSRVLKTLVAAVDGSPVVAVVPVSGALDLKALAAVLGAKRAVKLDPAEAERVTGYVVGGISPLGRRRPGTTVLDAAVVSWDRVFVSAGRRGLEIELDPADLVSLTSGRLAPIARTDSVS